MSLLPSFKTPLMNYPDEGSKGLENLIQFGASGIVERDFFAEFSDGQIAFVQSVFIDNSQNSGPFEITFAGTNRGQRLVVQAYQQGVFPVSVPAGSMRYRAIGTPQTDVNVIFYNIALPVAVWGPTDGVLVTPTLINAPLDLEPSIAGDNILASPAMPGTSVRLYRGIFSVDNPALLKFTDGVGGAVLFAAQLTAGGSLTFQASGIPWVITSPGNDLILNMSAAVNTYGGYGYTDN